MLLAVDIGNTKTALGVFKDDKLIARWRVSTDTKRTEDEYSVILDGLFRLHKSLKCEDISGAIIASVVPHLVEILIKSIQFICPGILVKTVNSTLNLGINNLYKNPSEVGADRLANAVGGRHLFGIPIIIVDFGTATTLDVIDREGNYIGGVILPGVEMSADALFIRTAKLPRIPISLPKRVVGTTTVKSIQSGICFGVIGSVDSLVEQIWTELGYQTKVVATGGYAQMLSSVSKTINEVEPYLTLYGLNQIWRLNKEE
ncbi:type III pantothenate kinase [Candidatus Sumerlaeota bacterium]|nr:type III pantothenate kinase [Candidatus Sumerlaeota bacterium]